MAQVLDDADDDVRRDGRRQRQMQRQQNEENHSVLARWLLQQWGWGKLSAPQVQEIANLASLDTQTAMAFGRVMPRLGRLASLGGQRAEVANMGRDLVRSLPPKDLETQQFEMTMVRGEAVMQEMLLPHMAFAQLYEHYPQWFFSKVCNEEKQVQFWSEMNVEGHPVGERDLGLAIPIGIHGDGVPVVAPGKTWQKSLDCINWSSLVGAGSTLETRFVIWVCFAHLQGQILGTKDHSMHAERHLPNNGLSLNLSGAKSPFTLGLNFHGRVGPSIWLRTMTRFWRLMRWSLEALWHGTWPTADAWGRDFDGDSVDGQRAGLPLAGGYYGVLWTIQGDLDWYHKAFHLSHWRHAQPCFLCQAKTTTLPWNVFLEDAPWRATTWQGDAWLAAHAERHFLLTLPGVSIISVYPDWLHCKHLGVDQYFLGSVLWMLVYVLSPGQEPQEAMHAVWEALQEQYGLQQTTGKFSMMRLSMFTNPTSPTAAFPRLKGKGNEVRHLTRPLWEVFRAWPKPDEEYYLQVELALKMSVDMELFLDDNGGFVLEQPLVFKKLVNDFLLLYVDLGQQAVQRGQLLFLTTIKTHYLAHLAESPLNPRKTWNYSGEDLMQKIKTIASASVRGTKGAMVHNKVMAKYSFAMHLMMLPA